MSRRLRWTGYVARMEKCRSAFKILIGTPTEKRTLGRPRRRWEDNIRMDLKEVGISLTYTMAQQPLKSFDRPLMGVYLSNSILVSYFLLEAE